jgi:hypothetical protein
MTKENQILQLELQDQKLKNKLKIQTKEKETDDDDGKLRLRHIAQSFALCYNLWVRTRPEVLSAIQIPPNYNPSTRYAPNVDDPAFKAVDHELYGVLHDFNSHVKEGEKDYAKSGPVLRTVSILAQV